MEFIFIKLQNCANTEVDKTEILINLQNRTLSTEIVYKKPKINRNNFENSNDIWKCLLVFFGFFLIFNIS